MKVGARFTTFTGRQGNLLEVHDDGKAVVLFDDGGRRSYPVTLVRDWIEYHNRVSHGTIAEYTMRLD